MAIARCGWTALAGFGFLVFGCVGQPGAERIVGPDGTKMLHVHCGDEQVSCFQLAGDLCPHGYDLSPIFDPHDGNFLVRCRDVPPNVTITTRPATRIVSSNASTGPANAWPPEEVAKPTEPWPAPSASALPPTTHTESGAVDIGY